YWEARKLIPFSLGNIAVTTAGKLPAKKIFHGVVIDWYKGIFPSTNIIQQVVHNCLEKAHQYGFSSIAFPLLGTGAAGFPVQEALEITLKQIISDLSQENQNILVAIVAIYNINDGREILKQLNLKNFLERI
ncbi:MAG TPA: macro domain-containing protein, partial [Coleofasciculaceae cyanobacterium]